MTIDESIANTTLICTVHHRRSIPFELGMQKLADAGLNRIWILESGENAWGEYQGPKEAWFNMKYGPFSGVMLNFYNSIIPNTGKQVTIPDDIKRIMLIDNDCFIIDPQDTVEYLTTFVEEEYDLACLSSFLCPYRSQNNIIVPLDLALVSNCLTPGGIAYSIFKRETIWNQITDPRAQFFPSTIYGFWERLVALHPKFGVHRMDLETKVQMVNGIVSPGYSQFELNKWLHLGNLMTSYFNLDQHKTPTDPVRTGYFAKYFPERLHYTEDKIKKFRNIWERFTNFQL